MDLLAAKKIADAYPLSPSQEGMLFESVLKENAVNKPYVTQLVEELTGEIKSECLLTAWQKVLDRHAVLRSSFFWSGLERPVQVVHTELRVPLAELDWQQCREEEIRPKLDLLLAAELRRGFDLAHPPLMRLTLIRLAERRWLQLWSFHHLILDGWSRAIVEREVRAVYRQLTVGVDADLGAPVPYARYIDWVAANPAGPAELFWRTALSGFREPTLLPFGPQSGTTGVGNLEITVPADRSKRIQEAARDQRLTMSTLFVAAWALVMGQLCGSDDVVFGVAVSGRSCDVPGIESIVGMIVNVLPMRVRRPGSGTVLDWLREVQEQQASMRQYEHTSLTDIRKWSDLNNSSKPFDTILTYQNHLRPAEPDLADDAPRSQRYGGAEWSGEPLTITAGFADSLIVHCSYDTGLLAHAMVDALASRLAWVMGELATQPRLPVSQLGLLPPSERELVLDTWNDAARRPAASDLVPARFEAQAARTPDAEAIVCEHASLTYRELNERANRLSAQLIKAGAGPERLIGLALPRDELLVVALLAVIKAGAAYLPVDLDYPRERITRMLGDSRPELVLTTSAYRGLLEPAGLPLLTLDDEQLIGTLAGLPDSNPAAEDLNGPLRAANAAYAIYTSGSTGLPKGVVITHSGLADVAEWALEFFGPAGLAKVMATSSVSFDPHLLELVFPLLCGGRVEILPNALSLGARPDRPGPAESASLIDIVPSVLAELLAGPGLRVSAETVIVMGEQVSRSLVQAIRATQPGCRLVNLYGPTEVSIYSAAWCSDDTSMTDLERLLPIGRPVRNRKILVLDKRLQPVPAGVVGEVYITGPGLGRGFLRRPSLTARRFVACPFADAGARMYRSGDLARWRGDGEIDFVGRADFQVKVRGFRIELGEIEAVLNSDPEVDRCVCMVREDRPGDKRVIAYVVPADGADADPARLRAQVGQALPAYMIPAVIVCLDRLPLSPNGKVDRGALPAPSANAIAGRTPSTWREQTLARLFADALGLEQVGAEESFFELGGHSLLAMRLISQIKSELGLDVSIRDLFETPTVASLAGRISRSEDGSSLETLLPIRPAGTGTPLFCLHPLLGLSWCYSGLLPHLDSSEPIYGLQSRGILAPHRLPASIEEMAADYLSELKKVQPHGPYRLLGWSMGGIVAHAMAGQLRRQSEQVDLLVMLDSPVSHRGETGPAGEATLEELAWDIGYRDRAELSEVSVDSLADHVMGNDLRMRECGKTAMTALISSALVSLQLLRNYIPGRYEGDVIFFEAGRGEPADLGRGRGWRRFVGGQLEVVTIGCTHDEMANPRSLAQVGRLINGRQARF